MKSASTIQAITATRKKAAPTALVSVFLAPGPRAAALQESGAQAKTKPALMIQTTTATPIMAALTASASASAAPAPIPSSPSARRRHLLPAAASPVKNAPGQIRSAWMTRETAAIRPRAAPIAPEYVLALHVEALQV